MSHRIAVFAAAFVLSCAIAAPGARAAGDPDGDKGPTSSPSSGTKSDSKQTNKKKKQKKSERELREGYLTARAMIMDGDYAGGIKALHALDADDHPEVANYIGYAKRKLGDYESSRQWYERALASDPQHVRTWQYYGMWHVEQGNMLKAQDHLEKIRLICGADCKEYQDLKGGMEGTVAY